MGFINEINKFFIKIKLGFFLLSRFMYLMTFHFFYGKYLITLTKFSIFNFDFKRPDKVPLRICNVVIFKKYNLVIVQIINYQ